MASVLLTVGLVGATVAGASSDAPMVASLRSLPPPKALPAGVDIVFRRGGAHVGISADVARERTRLLLRDVTGLPLYAFGGTYGRVCFFLWRGGGTCGEVSASHDVISVVNGGSRKRGQAVVGVVSDRVRAVDVWLGRRVVRTSVRHNAFFVPFRLGPYEGAPRTQVVPIIR